MLLSAGICASLSACCVRALMQRFHIHEMYKYDIRMLDYSWSQRSVLTIFTIFQHLTATAL